jgi:putative ABC transport system permease protein
VAIVFKQYRYAFNYDVGFHKENILDIPLKDANYRTLEIELKRLHEVSAVSMSSSIPGNWGISATWAKAFTNADSLEVYQMFVDQHYIDNLELTLIAGSNFPEIASTDEEYVIVNETFARTFNLGSAHDALNRTILTNNGKELRVVGVVKDFNYMPLREEIHSFFFRYDPVQFKYANVKLKSDNTPETLARIERSWERLSAQKFEAHFLDDEMETSITPFRNMIKIFGFLGLLTITISCLGLLAVVISAVESRTKEMGIRKILGASVPNLAFILSSGFLKLIVISILIATPVTYFIFDKVFLEINYYRANIGVTEIAMGILLLLLMIAVIIGSQTLKVANINPVETLKYE